MGNLLSSLSKHRVERPQFAFFLANSLSKIYEYYGAYKAISDTFAIDDSEFVEIFGNKLDIFELFDTDKNLLIDGLELFSGIILLSKTVEFRDKIQFLFSLFDFNDIKSLSKTDLEFMFLSCCTAVHKIFEFKGSLDEEGLQQFLNEEFVSDERVNISEILKWAVKSDTISRFFEKILAKPECNQQSVLAEKIYLKQKHAKQFPNTITSYEHAQNIFLSNSLSLFQSEETNLKSCDLTPSIKWVYGIRHKDVKQFLQYISEEEVLLYYVSKVVVVFSLKNSRQRHYNGHRRQVISVATHGVTVATGQYGFEPQIRIWDCVSLETKQILKGTHVTGVHLLKFFKAGEMLVTCGCAQKTPILIYDIQRGSILFSFHCQFPAVDISLLLNLTGNVTHEFIVASLYEVYHFAMEDQKVVMELVPNSLAVSRIGCCGFIQTNSKLKLLREYDESVQKLILTGHEDGSVCIWNRRFLVSEGNEVLKIITTSRSILIITDSSFLSFWNIELTEKQKAIDVTQMLTTFKSYDVSEVLLLSEGRMLVMTKLGDLFILGQEKPNENIFKYKLAETIYDVRVLDMILAFDEVINGIRLLRVQDETHLYVGLHKCIKVINMGSHKEFREWNIGQQITAFDIQFSKQSGTILIAGTSSNKICCQINQNEDPSKLQIEARIMSISILGDEGGALGCTVLVGCANSYIYKLSHSRHQITFINSIQLPSAPIYINAFENRVAVIVSEDDEMYLLTTKSAQKDMHFSKANEVKTHYANPTMKLLMNCVYTRHPLPVITGSCPKAFCVARRNGDIDIWKNEQALIFDSKISLVGHSSACSDLSITDDQRVMISTGKSDCMIAEWDMPFFIEKNTVASPFKLQHQVAETSANSIMERKVGFCTFQNTILAKLYDEHLLVRGIRNQILCRLFISNMREWENINMTTRFRNEPRVSLKLDYVFGMETYHKCNTVIALSNPKRFVYFVSKVVIKYDPAQNVQAIYMGHKYKVTCIVLLQDKATIASGECSYKPGIHIWNVHSLETIRVIQTVHSWGIIELVSEQHILLSYGLQQQFKSEQNLQFSGLHQSESEQSTFSLQLTDYTTGYLIAHRTEVSVVYAMGINPLDLNELVTATQNRVTFWKVHFNTIVKKAVCIVQGDIVTCFIHIKVGPVEADLIVGTKSGQLGMITKRRHFINIKREQGHSAQINCILPIKRNGVDIFITSSEDDTLRVWSSRFEEMFVQDTRKIDFEDSFKKISEGKNNERTQRSFAVQSISELQRSDKSLSLLIATRNGEISQMIQNSLYTNFSFKYVLYLKSNLSQCVTNRRKVLIAHYPRSQILVTISQDQNLLFWDTQRRRFIFSSYLGFQKEKSVPTAIRFTQSGDYLIIGYSDGLLVFLDSKISRSTQVKTDDKYMPPSLNVVKKEKDEEGHAVLSIEMSEQGDHLAVSYHKVNSVKSHSYIQLYLTKFKEKIKNHQKFDNDRIFEKFSKVPCPYVEKVFHSNHGVNFGFAAYSMAFVQHESKHYILIYYQLIDEQQRRYPSQSQSDQEKNYKIWDISTSTVIANSNLIDSFKWKKFYIHNSLNCLYRIYPRSLSLHSAANQDELPNNNLLHPEMTNMSIFSDFIILGSTNGDLHILRTSALHYPQTSEQSPQPEEMCVAKTFPGHSSGINQLQSNPDRSILYTTGTGDECVMKWIVETSGNAEQSPYKEDSKDIFHEVPSEEQLQEMKEIWSKRGLRKGQASTDFIEKIEIKDVLGRKAIGVRNNVKYDHSGRVIYSSGHTLLAYTSEKKSMIFLREENPFQDIAVIELNHDRRRVYCCHNGVPAGLIIWESDSETPIKQMALSVISQVLYLSVSDAGERVIVYGLNSEAHAFILMIDTEKEDLIAVASCSHKAAWHIKALSFVPGTQSRFITCGVEENKLWTLTGSHLTYKELLFSPSLDSEIINTCISFVGNVLVTGCVDGSLVFWKAQPFRAIQHSCAVLCLASEKQALVSGGKDCYIIIWDCSHNDLRTLGKIDLNGMSLQQSNYIITSTISSEKAKEVSVQSLCMRDGRILIGASSGDIYESEKGKVTALLRFHDDEKPIAMFFANNELFEISSQGLLSVWGLNLVSNRAKNFQTSKSLPNIFVRPKQFSTLLYSHAFREPTIQMIYSQKKQMVFIAFEQKVRSFRVVTKGHTLLQEAQQQFLAIVRITHLLISSNEKMLAVGVERNSNKSRLIEVYDISKEAFKLVFKIPLEQSILFFDFNRSVSKQRAYILVQMSNKLELWDLNAHKSVNTEQVSRIDWGQKCLGFSEETELARKGFKRDFEGRKIKSLVKLESGKYLLIDTCGGVVVYESDRLVSQSRMNLTDVSALALSQDRHHLAVCSEMNRSVVVMNIERCLSASG